MCGISHKWCCSTIFFSSPSAISNSFWDIWREILRKYYEFMTSSLTSRHLDELSVWIIYTDYAVDDYVKRWSNSVRNCRRNSKLKVMMSRVWRRSHMTSSVTSPFDGACPLSCRLPIGKYSLSATVSEIFGLKCYEFMTSLLTSWRLDQLSVWTL